MIDEGIQLYMDMMWNETWGNAMQWLYGMNPVGIQLYINMMCNVMIVWDDTWGNSIINKYDVEWSTRECYVWEFNDI